MTTEEFAELLDYEVRNARRYCRFVSVVMVGSGNGRVNNWGIFHHTLRESDELLSVGDEAAVLMGETERPGALRAVDRYKVTLDDGVRDLRFAVAQFPEDAQGAVALIRVAQKRLERAKQGAPWDVAAGH